MSKTALVLKRISDIFGDGEEVCASDVLLDYLIRHPNTNHINLEFVRQLGLKTGASLSDKSILRSLQYLAGDAVNLIEICFELIEDEWNIFTLSEEQVQAAYSDKINPITGAEDGEILNKIFIYYRPVADAFSQLEEK